MTSLIAWVAVDQRGPSAFYFASDSRLSNQTTNWDSGRKLFACVNSSDAFGYCGSVLFPSQVLGQLVLQIDAGALFPDTSTPEQRFEIVTDRIESAVVGFPENSGFSIAYATRDGEGFRSTFFVAVLTWSQTNGITTQKYAIPTQSELLFAYGSGAPVVRDFTFNWTYHETRRTSRGVFSSFCDAISSGRDRYTGGPPQLVAIYLRGPAKSLGVIHEGNCYINGMRATITTATNVDCRNSLFEVCSVDGQLRGQRHARRRTT